MFAQSKLLSVALALTGLLAPSVSALALPATGPEATPDEPKLESRFSPGQAMGAIFFAASGCFPYGTGTYDIPWQMPLTIPSAFSNLPSFEFSDISAPASCTLQFWTGENLSSTQTCSNSNLGAKTGSFRIGDLSSGACHSVPGNSRCVSIVC